MLKVLAQPPDEESINSAPCFGRGPILFIAQVQVAIAWGIAFAHMADSSAVALMPVADLSDDDCPASVLVPDPGPGRMQPAAKRRPAIQRPRGKRKQLQRSMNARTLRYRVDSYCGCRCKCFQPFKDMTVFANLLGVHKTLDSMDKSEQDKYVQSSLFPQRKQCQYLSKTCVQSACPV